MGNQNTSGIAEEEAKSEAADNAHGVSPPNAVTVVDAAAEAEAGKIPHDERQEPSNDKDIEDHKGYFEGSDAVNGWDLGEGRSKFSGSGSSTHSEPSDEEQDQPCTLTGEMQNHQAVNATTSAIQEEQNVVKDDSEVDDQDGKKNVEELVLADSASLEGTFLVARQHEEELERYDEAPQEEQSSLAVSSAAENECLALDHEEKPMIHGSGNGDANGTSCVDQDQPFDQETNEFLIRCSSDPTEEFEEKVDDLLVDAEKQEENEATDQNVLEKATQLESETSATENGHETTEKCVTDLQSSIKIDTQHLPNNTTEAETSKETESIGAQLRKSPSFDFGISFDTRSDESDQTPLLYQDKTARRSLSTCSNLRFPNTEFVGKPLQFQAVQVEEKTIRMERSNSETAPNSLTNKQENGNAVTKETHENGSTASPSRDSAAAAAESSPKGNGRRKARSSLFTTCICCTAAIS